MNAMGDIISRRAFAAAGAAAAIVRPALAEETPSGDITCRVIRGGKQIGTASYVFDRQGDRLKVAIAIDIRIHVGFLTVFRYQHSNVENWDGHRLLGFDARTDNNGSAENAHARWNGAVLEVSGSRTEPYTAPEGAIGTSYWNPRTLSAPLINTQNGKLLNVRLMPVGPSRAVLATGRTVAANEYRMVGDVRMNLWYDTTPSWAGLQYFAHDGSVVSYEKA